MFVHRTVSNVSIGNFSEAAALWKEFFERFPPPHAFRILTSWLYPSSALVVEYEFEGLGEYEEYWRGFHANPEIAAWVSENAERLDAVSEEGPSIQEMWQVR